MEDAEKSLLEAYLPKSGNFNDLSIKETFLIYKMLKEIEHGKLKSRQIEDEIKEIFWRILNK